MVYDEIFFGGDVLPCVVERFPTIRKAQRKHKVYNIPGRNGDIIVQQDAYENVILPYRVYCGEEGDVQTDWDDLAKVLYKNGYQKLNDIADPEHFRKAIFNGPVDAEYYWRQVGRTTLEFNCRPERYRNDGAVSRDFEDATYDLKLWKMSELSSFLQGQSWPAGTETMYEFYIDASWGNDFYLLNYQNYDNSGAVFFVELSSTQTPDTANYGSTSWQRYVYNGKLTENHGAAIKFLIPSQYFNGAPMFAAIDPNDGTLIHYGNAGEPPIVNDYMPCYPDIILENLIAYTGEKIAAHINGYGIYITYDQYSPFYFVDTENFIIAKSDTLTGNRMLATNARMDAGIKLEPGENIVYTSQQYSIPSLIPNFWEL